MRRLYILGILLVIVGSLVLTSCVTGGGMMSGQDDMMGQGGQMGSGGMMGPSMMGPGMMGGWGGTTRTQNKSPLVRPPKR